MKAAGLDFVRPERSLAAQLVGGRGHYEVVIPAVAAALRSVWIATANLKELMVEDPRARPGVRRTMRRGRGAYRSVLAVLDERVGHGVEVRILHASTPSGPFRTELRRWPRLRKAMALRACPRVHMKMVIIDGGFAYLGSANWTGAGLGAKGEGRRNFELGVVSRDDLLLDEVQAYYDEIWRGGPCAACKLRETCPGPLDAITSSRRGVEPS